MASTSPRLSKKCSRRGGICPSEPAETYKGAPAKSLLLGQTKNAILDAWNAIRPAICPAHDVSIQHIMEAADSALP